MTSPTTIDMNHEKIDDEDEAVFGSRDVEAHEAGSSVNAWRGVLICVLLLWSSLFGSLFVLFPLLPLMWFRLRTYRSLIDNILSLWQQLCVVCKI